MPGSIGDNIREDIGDNVDHIISDSISHHLDDSVIDNMSDILQEAKCVTQSTIKVKPCLTVCW
jgi:hypothetical protein